MSDSGIRGEDEVGIGERNLTTRTLSGVGWTFGRSIGNKFLGLAVTAVLARLLPPAAFGLVALAGVVLGFLTHFSRMGLAQAIVQKPDLSERDVRAGFTSSVALGLVAFAAVWLAAPWAVRVFDEPELLGVLRLIALALVLASLRMTAEALMQREMAFRADAIRSVLGTVVGAIVSVSLAFAGFGVYALVYGALAHNAAQGLLAYLYVRHAVRPVLRVAAYRPLLSYGGRLSVIGFVEFVGQQLDTMLIGRWAGSAQLGLYDRAHMLVRLPAMTFTTNLVKVVFPVFSAIQSDARRLGRAYVEAIELTAAFVVPLCAGIAVAAPEMIRTVLGEQWTDSAPLVPYFAVAAAASMLAHFSAVLCDARAMLRQKFRIAVTKLVFFALLLGGASLLVELRWFAVALAAAEGLALVLYARLHARTLALRQTWIVLPLLRPLAAAALVAGTIAVVRLGAIGAGLYVAVTFLLEIVTGGLTLWLCARLGPLRSARAVLAERLHHAGVLSGKGAFARMTRLVIGPRQAPAQPVR